MSEEGFNLARIGAGSFAEVFVWEGRNSVALKIVKDSSRCPELLREFQALESASKCMSGQGLLFSIPAVSDYYTSFGLFRRDMALQQTVEGMEDIACLYAMERVWPVPRNLILVIRERFFPPQYKEYEKGFLARIYLGKKRNGSADRPRRFFNPNNWALDTDSLEELDLPTGRISMDMGRLLARLHFVASCDARDVEFVLGGDPLDPFKKFKCYCFDFNQVRQVDQNDRKSFVATVVDSFFMNDPYYPRPSMKLWEEFKMGYLTEASSAVQENRQRTRMLAEEILEGICQRAGDKSAGF